MNDKLCACGLTEEHCIHPGCVTRATLKPPAAGMTMRDYFAAKAMQGYIVGTEQPMVDNIARVAYEVADEMLKARSKA